MSFHLRAPPQKTKQNAQRLGPGAIVVQWTFKDDNQPKQTKKQTRDSYSIGDF